jgi:futalosine hydrolase
MAWLNLHMLLLCAATEFEIQNILAFMKSNQVEKRVHMLITGVGILNTAYALTKKIYEIKPTLIIQAGIGGSLDPLINLSKVFAIKEETLGDFGVMENGSFRSIADLHLMDQNSFPWNKGKLSNPNTMLLATTGLPFQNGVTVQEITTNPQRIDYYKQAFDATIESMEGAALHYVALRENIPFVQIRAVSNYTGERDKTKWKMNVAVDNLNLELKRIIYTLLKL